MHKILRSPMVLGAALVLGAGIATALNPASQPSLADMVLLPAAQVSVVPESSLPTPVQQLEALHVPELLDKDTTTAYTAFGTSTVTVSFPAQSMVQALRVHGPASYKLTVQARANAQSAYQAIAGLGAIDLSALSPGAWNTLSLPAPVAASDIQLVLQPQQAGGNGLAEIEFWGAGRHGNMAGLGTAGLAQPLAPEAISAPATNVQSGQAVTVGDPAAGGASAGFTVQVPLMPSQIARAHLVYELSGAAHWSDAARSINGAAQQGGHVRQASSSFTLQAEPISPASLVQGPNTIQFSNGGDLPAYQIRNVRVAIEPFDGWNGVASAASNQGPADSVLDGDGTTGWSIHPLNASRASAQPWLTAELSQVTALDSLRFQLTKALDGTVSVDVLTAGKWRTVAADLPGSGFTAGWNVLPLSQAKASAVRLRFAGGSSTALLTELAATGSPAGSPSAAPRLAVTYPDNGQYFGDIAFVRGFIAPQQDKAGAATVTVAGKPVTLSQGTFEAAVSKADLGIAAGAANWQVEVRAAYPGGVQVSRTVQFTTLMNATQADQAGANGLATDLVPGAARLVSNQGAALEVGADALKQKTRVTMHSLRAVDLAALDRGMINVTKAGASGPGAAGYRFLPHGQKFQKHVKVRLPYDKSKLPQGMKESDIKTFYFDREAGKWEPLQTAATDTSKGEIVSLTTHFTDMINAVVQTPDSPEAASFNPTQLKDIKVANPGAKVNLIAPPQANAMGDVHLSYPVEVPAGRAGHSPQLALSYNSSAANGWLGAGWDLSVSSVGIDTRWGVPRYDATNETETYTLDGEQLAPLAHRGALVPRTADKTFRPRVEGGFRKIVRHGSSPSTYWWEVREKDGTAYYYGGDPAANAPVPGAVLADASGNIFKWALRLVQDTNGNTIHYNYASVTDSGTGDGTGGVPGSELYIQAIDYTGFGATPGAYLVQFTRDRDLSEPRRPDPIVNARGGFKAVTADLLRKIAVSYNGQPIRSYELVYQTGAYNKTLLKTLKQYDAAGALFNQHQFDYFDDTRDAAGNYLGFGAATAWNTGADNVQASGLLSNMQSSALGSQQGSGFGGHLYIGIGWAATKSQSVGAKIGSNSSDSDGLLAFIDINGDSLPDKVFNNNGTISYRANQSGPSGTAAFGPAVTIATLPAISQEHSNMTSAGPEAYAGIGYIGAFIGFNQSTTTTEQTVYFTDANGDGLPDLVLNGIVLFNSLQGGTPSFGPDSSVTPYPVGPGAVTAGLMTAQQAALSAKLDAANPLVDTVRRWVAPFSGTVAIAGPLNLVQDTGAKRAAYKTADGVRAAIQLNGTELYSVRIQPDDYAPKTPTGVSSIAVNKGDILYFRVQSAGDGSYDQVNWSPAIAYQGVPAAVDSNNLNPYIHGEAADFTLHGFRAAHIGVPYDGTVQVTGSLVKSGATSDDIQLVLYKNGAAIATQSLAASATGALTLNRSVSVQKTLTDSNGNVTRQGDTLELRIAVDSRIDMTRLAWDPASPPTVAYTQSPDLPQGSAMPSMEMVTGADLYASSDLTAPLVPFDVPAQGTYTFDVSVTGGTQGSVIATAKTPGVLLAKQAIAVGGGTPATASLTFSANAGDKVFFELHARSADAAAGVTAYGVTQSGGAATPAAALHSASPADILPQDYRGWTHFGYNGQGANAQVPIAIGQNDLTLGNLQGLDTGAYRQQIADAINNGTDPSTIAAQFRTNVIAYVPRTAQGAWAGPDASLWATAQRMSASRQGATKYIPAATADPYAGLGAVARISENDQTAIAGGATITLPGTGLGVNGSVSYTSGNASSILDFKDLNGDGFPDVVAGGLTVQYSPMTGGLESATRTLSGVPGDPQNSTSQANSYGVGGNYAFSGASPLGLFGIRGGGGRSGTTAGDTSQQMTTLGISATISQGTSLVSYDLIDINGDGLPDRVSSQGGAIAVQINLGYGFAEPETWDAAGGNAINSGQNKATALGGSVGYNDGNYGFGGGINTSEHRSKSVITLQDIDGDGLPDRVTKTGSSITVGFNTGAGFAPDAAFAGASGEIAGSRQETQGGGAYFTIAIPIYSVYLIINPGADYDTHVGRTEATIADIDGDGSPDYLSSTADGSIAAGLNTRGRTNLLKGVTRPLGAFFTVDYARTGNSYSQPHNRWAMSSLTVNDGQPGDGQDTGVTSFAWSGGFYERRERTFYGFAQCVETHLDPANNNAPYRAVTRTYNNSTYYLKGLLAQETLSNASGNKYTDATHTYVVRDESTQSPLANPADLTAVAFPQHVRTDKSWFEGQAAAGKTTYETFAYDQYGNITGYVDGADRGPSGVAEARIGYWQDPAAYITKANSISVHGGGTLMRQRSATFQPGTGNLLEVVKSPASGPAAVTNLTYDAYGNIKTVTGPQNATGQRYQKTYTYDPAVNTYVTSVTDSFGYTSSADYDLRFGVTTRSTDINNQVIASQYDAAGRPVAMVGPYEQGTGRVTIAMDYHPGAAVPWAHTAHLDLNRGPTATIDTVTFIDGLQRATQTKKALALHTAGNTSMDVMSVSGRVVYDGFGRATQAYYPTTEPLGQAGTLNAAFDTVQPTVTGYDVLDRPLSVKNPANETTRFAYGFGNDRGNAAQFWTRVTDANNVPRDVFRNVHDDITSVRLLNNGGAVSLWTSYAYDPLDEILTVTDNAGNVTSAAYDNFGRRVTLVSPDAGRTDYVFDPASNLTQKITANLKATGQAVNYSYQYNRLAAVTYPKYPANNATYTYGGPGAAGNAAGRVIQMTAEGGTLQRAYGPLGEVTKEIRTPAQDTVTGPDPVFTTLFSYDTWNRIQNLTYSDGEVLSFKYDSGGNIKAITGQKQAIAYKYLNFIGYDKFEARERVALGNGTVSNYTYNPLNRRLTGLLAQTKSARTFMAMSYGYDAVGNIKTLANSAAIPAGTALKGGTTAYSFGYDDLYQLTSSTGAFAKPNIPTQKFTLAMAYDGIHNITRKTQTAFNQLSNGSKTPNLPLSYDWAYAYAGGRPHAASQVGNRAFLYDLDGNQAGWNATDSAQNRRNVWDEDGRLQQVTDNSGQPTTFKYDGDTNRVIKKGAGGETLYVNPWYVAALGRNSKQVFAGGTRIATKLEQFRSGEGYGTGAKNLTSVYQYFYHQDHLGSTGFATDTTGEVYQHLEYFPFGETWVNEVSDDLRVRYRFTGQEFDQETKLYYHGARYYDPRTSVWQSPDRILGEYLNGKPSHGVFEPRNLALNSYAHQSPVVLRDADGNWVPLILGAIWLVDKGMAAYDAYQDYKAIQSGEKTIGDVALERGTGYAAGAIVPGGGLATKLGGRIFKKVEKAADAVGEGGTATIRRYGNPKNISEVHYDIEVVSGNKKLATDQVITSADKQSTRIRMGGNKADVREPKLGEIGLQDAEAAMREQKRLVGSGNLGPYDRVQNSCVSHVCDILRAGGAKDVPAPSGRNQMRYLDNIIKKAE